MEKCYTVNAFFFRRKRPSLRDLTTSRKIAEVNPLIFEIFSYNKGNENRPERST